MHNKEQHRTARIGWLRAAVLGANDGVVSTASLVIGVAAAGAARGEILIAGVAGLVAGAMSMAAGEYVSVRSQADTERADLDRERRELAAEPAFELDELAAIYESRGLDAPLARQVAEQLTAHDVLSAHARDELGISVTVTARPVQAAFVSAGTFAIGAAMPVLTVLLATDRMRIPIVAASERAPAVHPSGPERSASLSGAHWPWRSPRRSGRSAGPSYDARAVSRRHDPDPVDPVLKR